MAAEIPGLPSEAQAIIATLPPWAQAVASVGVLFAMLATWFVSYRRGHRDAPDGERADTAALLEASPVKRFLEALPDIRDMMRTELDRQEDERRYDQRLKEALRDRGVAT